MTEILFLLRTAAAAAGEQLRLMLRRRPNVNRRAGGP
jgi:hypothetical protein